MRDNPSIELICAPGNAGISEMAECIPVKPEDVRGLHAFAERAEVDMTFVGPEGPLALGIVDRFRESGRAIFGPTAAAAEIETSKRFAKDLMQLAGVPTATATHHTDARAAIAAVARSPMPVVIKASGLAAGKGVVIARSAEEAERAIYMMIEDRAFGDAGSEILIEEFMDGEELSVFVLTDGVNMLPMIGAQDHKRLLDRDLGPNTGGMGAYAPVSIGSAQLIEDVLDRIVEPTLAALRDNGRPFTGLLYAGIMTGESGPRVVEFNCRFGDPETETLLPLMQSSLLEPAAAIARGESIAGAAPIVWNDGYAATTVLAAEGYPDAPRKGDEIRLPAPTAGLHVFHAGTVRDADTGILRTSGGRVLAVTGTGPTLEDASRCSREFAERVTFEGRQFRRDIGWRELERSAGAA